MALPRLCVSCVFPLIKPRSCFFVVSAGLLAGGSIFVATFCSGCVEIVFGVHVLGVENLRASVSNRVALEFGGAGTDILDVGGCSFAKVEYSIISSVE